MDDSKIVSIDKITYKTHPYIRQTKHKKSISVIGLDTETLYNGQCFLICTSNGDSFTRDECPEFFFSRGYRGKKFVVWNLQFDESSLLQNLSKEALTKLRTTNKTTYMGYTYKSIPHKSLSIVKGKNGIEIFDIAGFFGMSLQKASQKYLGKSKLDLNVDGMTEEFVRTNYDKIVKYCIQDCKLTKELAEMLIKKFEDFGVYPQKLYSTAYVSWQYFKNHCDIPLVKNIYENHPECLQMAIESYNGGKFEVTQKGVGKYYEYDIVSAYPYEISNLVDIRHAYVVRDKKYRRGAVYGFLRCKIVIPDNVYSPLAVKEKMLNIYPVGYIVKTITKKEYEYLLTVGCDITILDAYWLEIAYRVHPFRKEINRLIKKKDIYKMNKQELDYHTIKIFMNSLYGKFVQLIKKDEKYIAGYNWNIIYGSVITANCRIRISEYQQKYPSVIAVHTDSVISYKKLPLPDTGGLGEMVFEISGKGIILGSGIYQVGKKTKFRGFSTKLNLLSILENTKETLSIDHRRPYSWREVNFHNWESEMINLFVNIKKNVNINFDKKRIWIDDYKEYTEVLKRNVYSIPIVYI